MQEGVHQGEALKERCLMRYKCQGTQQSEQLPRRLDDLGEALEGSVSLGVGLCQG